MFYEQLAWFVTLWLCVLVLRRLGHSLRQPVCVSAAARQRKTPRPLKPRTPHDCPVCGRPHPTPLWGNVRQPGVLPWSERKSRRGQPKTICTAGYACPNTACDYYGNTDATFHGLVGCGRRGADRIQQFKCQACGRRFSCRRGTAL